MINGLTIVSLSCFLFTCLTSLYNDSEKVYFMLSLMCVRIDPERRICTNTLSFFLSPSPRIYCVTDIDPAHRKLSQLEAVIRFITAEEADLECEYGTYSY